MKNSTVHDHHMVPTAQDQAPRRLGRRYYVVFYVRIILLGILTFVILWVALNLFFPRVTRAESAMAQAATGILTQAVTGILTQAVTGILTQAVTYPSPTSTASMDEGQVGTMEYTVHLVSNKPGYAATQMNLPLPKGDFKIAYANNVEFYQETPSLRVAQFLDLFRAPEAAKDQLPMKLYDVDDLSAEEYKQLLEDLELMSQEADSYGEGDGKRSRTQPIVAFVTEANITPPARQSNSHEVARATRTSEFIGVPVLWTAVLEFLRYVKQTQDLVDYSPTTFIKHAMSAVIGSAKVRGEQPPDDVWFAESDGAKMYLAMASLNTPRATEITGLNSISAVSFRSAWDDSFKQPILEKLFTESGQADDHSERSNAGR